MPAQPAPSRRLPVAQAEAALGRTAHGHFLQHGVGAAHFCLIAHFPPAQFTGGQGAFPQGRVQGIPGNQAVPPPSGTLNGIALGAQRFHALPHRGAADAQLRADFLPGDKAASCQHFQNIPHSRSSSIAKLLQL